MNANPPSTVQMIFSTQNQSAESSSNALSFYLEENQWSRLLELVQEYGNFEIYKENNDKFLLKLGDFSFSIVKDFHKSMITMLNINVMTPGAAELLAKIADLMFYDRKRRFMILASHVEHEKITWTVCQDLQIQIKPADKGQSQRFEAWNAEYQLQNKLKFKSFAQSMLDQKQPPDAATPSSKGPLK